MNRKIYYYVCSALILLSCLFAFTTADKKICDLFLQNKNPVDKETDIFRIKNGGVMQDDKIGININREMYAESVLILRELGANVICIDDDFSHQGTQNIFFDEDEYLANCIKACRNVVIPFRLTNEQGKKKEEIEFAKNKFELKNVSAGNDKVTPVFTSIEPCIDCLSRSCEKSGFMNISPDKDGKIRRVHLIAKCDEKYYASEILISLLNVLDNPKIHIYNSRIVLESNAPSKKITIPRDSTGAVVLKYTADDFSQSKETDIETLYEIKLLENELVKNILEMEDDGFFDYTSEDLSPDISCQKFIDRKEYLFNILDKKPDMIDNAFKEYVIAKEDFIENVGLYVSSAAEEILTEIAEERKRNTDTIKKHFAELTKQYNEYSGLRNQIKQDAENAVCLVGNNEEQFALSQMILYPYLADGETGKYNSYFVKVMPWWVSLILALIICTGFLLMFERVDTLAKKITMGVLFAYFSIFVPYAVYNFTGIFVGAVIPLVSIYLVVITCVLMYVISERLAEYNAIQRIGRLNSKKVVQGYLASRNEGAKKRWMSVLVTDVKAFKKIENHFKEPAEFVSVLNRYYEFISDIILSHDGIIQSQQGDKIIAVFAEQNDDKLCAVNACRAALEIRKKENDFNTQFINNDKQEIEFFTRLAVNTGYFIAAETGTKNRMLFTATGSNMNAAFEMLSYFKEYNALGCFISETTLKGLEDKFMIRALDKVKSESLEKSVRLFELIDDADSASDDAWKLVEKWQGALKDYENGEYEKAKKAFDYIARVNKADKIAKMFSQRCTEA